MLQFLNHFYHKFFRLLVLGLCLFTIFVPTSSVLATPAPATEIPVSLGNTTNELKFFPERLEFSTGKRYKLRLSNPSPQKHYFTAKDLADASWTQKVEAGNVEVKGAIRELELKPQAEAEWVLIPLKSGTYSFRCPIPGHTEAGMMGKIAIHD